MANHSANVDSMTAFIERMAGAEAETFREQAQSTDDLFQRPGCFVASKACIANDPELFLRVLGEVVVIHAESLTDPDEISYIGFSHHFDLVEKGATPLTYMVVCTRHPADTDPAGVPMPETTSFEFSRHRRHRR